MATCHGIDAETFRTACEQAPAAEANTLVDEALAQSCPSPDGKADGLGEFAFVTSCRVALLGGFLVEKMRNPDSAPLADEIKTELRPYFGTIVDEARVHWNATLLDDWPIFHVKDVFMDVGAQTFGTHVFAKDADSGRTVLSMLAHELTHAKQAERFGGVYSFTGEYCRAFYRARFSYDDNALEVEARAEEEHIMGCVSGGC